ncbi:hypothetical protein PoB_002523300 [Plakobranchus ocellatus]|uniref:Uncharacterized protein n=1 Tax=Plakobranchus ocellatus TaxID=259542 RepID=A0AAV3ZWC5_9GAST|nr:hypothetical protein PoB_002523300 [Plakobranchus ocellatus]
MTIEVVGDMKSTIMIRRPQVEYAQKWSSNSSSRQVTEVKRRQIRPLLTLAFTRECAAFDNGWQPQSAIS